MVKKRKIFSPIFPQRQANGVKPEDFTPNSGAAGRTWTGTKSPSRDFKSLASAYSTTAARKMLSFVRKSHDFDENSFTKDFKSLASAYSTTRAYKKHKNSAQKMVQSFLEAPPGFEPGDKGFADIGLTAWL